jgi:hypothetical protein
MASESRDPSVWNYFAKKDEESAMCNACSTMINGLGGNLERHLKKVHSAAYLELQDLKKSERTADTDKYARQKRPPPMFAFSSFGRME